jgi:peptidoglycan/xylan/chitin deacetylase (PgdA/CDA1 family)
MRRLPIQWPDKARVAVLPCIVFETWPDDLGTAKSLQSEFRKGVPADARFPKDIASITDRQYGERVGMYRVLDLLAAEGIKTTFFVNGATVEAFPELMREIVGQGHELASENWRHEYAITQTEEEQRRDITRTVESFEKVLGVRPQGFIMPGERPTDLTPHLLVEHGYRYWMFSLNEDLPYVLQVDGGGELVIMCYGIWLTDHRTGRADAGRTPRELLQLWKDNFDYLYEEGERFPSFMSLGLHPFLIGRPFRATVLREFLRYAKGHPGVWFPRCIDVARYWLEHHRTNRIDLWPNYGTGLSRAKTKAKESLS